MLDRWLRCGAQPLLKWLARHSLYWRVTPLGASLTGLALVVMATVLLILHYYLAALAVLLGNRFFDGLDGALARAMDQDANAGEYLDTCLNTLYHVLLLIGFALAAPEHNALPALVLLALSSALEVTILCFRIQTAQRRGVLRHSHWFLRLLDTLTHSTARVVVFALACIWPERFALIAWNYSIVHGILLIARLTLGYRLLRQHDRVQQCRQIITLSVPDQTLCLRWSRPPWRHAKAFDALNPDHETKKKTA